MNLFEIIKKRKENKPRTIFVSTVSSKKTSVFLPFLFQFLLIFTCLVGFVYCVTTSLQTDIPFFVVVLIVLPILALCTLLSINLKVHIVFLSLFTIFVGMVFTVIKGLSEQIIDAFEFCYNRTIQIVVEEGYDNYAMFMTEDITQKLADNTLVNNYYYTVLLVLTILFSVLFTAFMMKKPMVWLCTLPCFVVLTPSLYYGAVPSGIAFAIFISGIIGCYVESISYLKNKWNKKRKQEVKEKKKKKSFEFLKKSAIGGFSNTILILIVSITVSVFVYSSDLLRLDDFREVIDDIAMRIMNVLFYEQYETPEAAIGGLIENDTLDLDVPEFRELPVMDITTRTNSPIYLRGWIGKTLGENGWQVLNENDTKNLNSVVSEEFKPYTQFYNFMTLMSTSELENAESEKDTQKLGFVYDTLNITAKFSKSKMVFVPVSGITGEIKGDYKGITTIGDTISFFDGERPKGNKYTMDSAVQSFVSSYFYVNLKDKQADYLKYAAQIAGKGGNLSASENFVINERKYSQYVRNNYLSLPNGTENFGKLADGIVEKYSHDFDRALAVERYLKTNYKYSLSSIELQGVSGTALDKINYVINKGKEGYCTYYASAMTIMMRELGIPARYVIGYYSRIKAEDGSQRYSRSIADKNYHAWVEVYFDGVGWLTFDPTPGYGNNAPIRDYDYLDNEAPGEAPDEQPTEQQEQQVVPQAPPPVHEVIENVPDAAKKDTITKILIIVALIALAISLVVAFMIFLKSVNVKYERMFKKLRVLNKTIMVRTIYPKIIKLLCAQGLDILPGEDIMSYANRVDSSIVMQNKLSEIITMLEMSQFSENEIPFDDSKQIYIYFKSLSNVSMKRFNIFKRYYYKIKLAKI